MTDNGWVLNKIKSSRLIIQDNCFSDVYKATQEIILSFVHYTQIFIFGSLIKINNKKLLE